MQFEHVLVKAALPVSTAFGVQEKGAFPARALLLRHADEPQEIIRGLVEILTCVDYVAFTSPSAMLRVFS